MKTAVTLASGQLGAAIAQQLIQQLGKDQVVGIARTPEKAAQLGIEIREGDYNHREHFDQALQGVDVVVIVSGNAHPQARIQQHRNVIEAAKLNGVQKIVYTSIVGDEQRSAFSPIVQSNRQTEQDVQQSGLAWAIGRNGIYIEPDLEYVDTYVKEGGIINCAGEGKCAYTSRAELAYAYAQMALGDSHNGQVYDLVGEPITQGQLADLINQVYGTQLSYQAVSAEAYEQDRKAALGEFLGTVIAGIYKGIQIGAYDLPSDFARAAGRAHMGPLEMMKAFKRG